MYFPSNKKMGKWTKVTKWTKTTLIIEILATKLQSFFSESIIISYLCPHPL